MRSFILACVSIVVIGVAASFATREYLGRSASDAGTSNSAVRLD